MDGSNRTLLEKFERLEISAPDFHHADHVRVAYEMLDAYDFVDACNRYATTIRKMATNVGVPEKFNTTITFAFMSLIAERKHFSHVSDSESFLDLNPDLLDKDILRRWYSTDRLMSPEARIHFLLPDRLLEATT